MSDRQLQGPAFPDDDGSADPALAAALTAYGASSEPEAYVAALARLQHARVLVSLLAVPGGAGGHAQDMAAALVQTPDGRKGLLAFTGTESLAAWNPDARPVPVTARTAAEAAVQEQAAALVLDVAGPTRFVVDGDSLTALAAGYTLARLDGGLAWVQTED